MRPQILLVDCASRFAGKALDDLLVVEIFAGSAKLTRACKGAGLRAVAVDKTNERTQGPHIFTCDVTDANDFNSLRSFLMAEKQKLAWVHFAPRERPQTKLEQAGYRVPKPLRSKEFPLGLPGLSGVDKLRTETANLVYDACAQLVQELVTWNVCCTIENPTNSLFWEVPCIQQLLSGLGGYECIFDNCCHGGQRKKNSKFWTSEPWFQALQASCPGDQIHFHKPWKPQITDGKLQYPTAEEAAYPDLLCSRLAELCRNQLLALRTSNSSFFRTIAVCTVWYYLRCQGARSSSRLCRNMERTCQSCIRQQLLRLVHSSSNAKLVHQRLAKWGDVRVDAETEGNIVHQSLHNAGDDDTVLVSQFGIPREPLDFLERAVACGHPRGMAVHLSEQVREVLRENLSLSPADLALKRCKELAKWTMRAAALKEEELVFKQGMQEHLRVLMSKKRLLLFQEILQAVQYPDSELVADIAAGFKLTGWQPQTGVFPSCVKRPQFDVETLKKLSSGLNRTVLGQLRREDDQDELVVGTWAKTLEEVSLGYIWQDHDSKPDDVFLAKRFGLLQRAGKLRVIDDCSIGGVNGTLGPRKNIGFMRLTSLLLSWLVPSTSILSWETRLDCKGEPMI